MSNPPIGLTMLIDDDETDNYVHTRVLKKSGLVEEVRAFQYAEKALTFLKSREADVDVIFLDINMPRMDGFEFLAHYHKLETDCQANAIILMLTTSRDSNDQERAAELGIHRFETKPLTLAMVEQVVRDLGR